MRELMDEEKGAEAGGAGGGNTTTAAATTATTATTTDTKGAAAGDGKAVTTAATGKETTETKGYWPEDWLAKVSKGDEKIAKQLGRYASPEAMAEAHISLRKRMDSGEFKTSLPKDPKPEELSAWRKDNGIPETPDKYDLKFDSGLVIGKEDKAVVDNFLKAAHAANYTPEQAKAAIEFRFQEREREAQERATMDDEQRIKTLDVLNGEWGGSFRRNVNLVNGLLDRFPADVKDALKSARLPDGTAIFNDPNVLRGFVAMALESNPAGVIAPAGTGDVGKAAMDEYKEIQKLMREDRPTYMKDANKQARMRELIDFLHKNGMIDAQGNEKKAA